MAERIGGRVVATAAGFLAAGLLGLPSGAAAAPAAAAPAAPAPTAGEWWWTAMGVDELHAQGRGKGVEVAVIDGPIDPDVPDLAGKVASSTTECLDPAAVSTPRPRSSRLAGPDAEHATSMAGLIAGTGRGTGPGGRGLRGIAPEATIRHYAVLFADAKAEDGYACGIDFPDGDDVDRAVGRAIAAAAKDGADVINVSLVTGYSQEIEDGLLAAYRAGAVVVAGTGNARGRTEWPGIGNGVVLVNPVGKDGLTPDFAAKSPYVALAAPGEDVMAGSYDESGWRSASTASGSSVATALVSGGIAALWSAHPEATAGQVLAAVKDNVGLRAKDSGGFETWFRRVGTGLPSVKSANDLYGWGIFDPADAVAADVTSLPTENPFVRADDPVNGPDPAAIAAATAGSSPAPSATASASAPAASPSATTSAAAPRSEDSEGSTLPLVLGGLAVLVLAGGVAVAVRRRASPSAGADPHPSVEGPTEHTTPIEGADGADRRTR